MGKIGVSLRVSKGATRLRQEYAREGAKYVYMGVTGSGRYKKKWDK
jgi:hypothetical protein